jgi:hypothetical protein
LQIEFGRYLQQVIKPIWTAVCAGDIDIGRAHVFHDILAPLDDDLAVAIATEYVARAGEWTTSQLRDRLRRAVLRADPDGATHRTQRTIEQRHVSLVPGSDSTASLFAVDLPAARAVAAFERVDSYARARRLDGDARTFDQLRADTFLDLLEGANIGCPPVHRRGVFELTIPWSTLSRGIDPAAPEPADTDDGPEEPGMLAGFGPIETPTARDPTSAMLDRDDVAWRFRIIGQHGVLRQFGALPAPRDAEQLPGLLDRIRNQANKTSQPPAETDPTRRTPGPALARWIRARDGTCRAPGCRTPASVCDIDHTVDHAAGGPTSHDNLALLCRHHHRLKHETGWRLTQPQPGTLVWTSPHGDPFTRTPN